MREIIQLLFSFLFFCPPAFSQFNDDFSDGNFNLSPPWEGDTVNFQVNTAQKLRLSAPSVTDTSYLWTASSSINNAIWSFRLRLDFNPSSSNYALVYLVADKAIDRPAVRGYYVKMGGTDDEISLFRDDGQQEIEIIDGTDDRLDFSGREFGVKVSRDSLGNWKLYSDTSSGGGNYILEGSVSDKRYYYSSFFGLVCRYTSTRSDKFFFDNFSVTGKAFQDTLPPYIEHFNAVNKNLLRLTFNERPSSAALQNGNFVLINHPLFPGKVYRDSLNADEILLSSPKGFEELKEQILIVSGIRDTAGNNMVTDTLRFQYFTLAGPVHRCLTFNEFLPDPEPSVGLPKAEFMELFNRSDSVYCLDKWTFSDGTSTGVLDSVFLFPGEYLLLCDRADTSLFPSANKIGLASWPSLNNGGDDLYLFDGAGVVIDSLHYDADFFEGSEKEKGGWSLEKLNPDRICWPGENWSYSNHPAGGTPGNENSVYRPFPDMNPPQIRNTITRSPDTLLILFNESVEAESLNALSLSFSTNITAGQVKQIGPRTLEVILSPSPPQGKVIELSINRLMDCSGSSLQKPIRTNFVFPQPADSSDLVINEVLFDPLPGGVDFVEVFNGSQKYIDLKEWRLADKDWLLDTLDKVVKITPRQKILAPGEYLLLTPDPVRTLMQYPHSNKKRFWEMTAFPSLNNDSDKVYLISYKGKIIDEFFYRENMHLSLLDNTEGISLERLSFERPTNHKSNWHSAAEEVGFATPGYRNSQHQKPFAQKGQFSIVPEVFSPDNDGFDDVLFFNYEFKKPGWVGNIWIYDAEGRPVKRLANNTVMATGGTFSWDGVDDRGQKAPVGVYILYLEAFNPKNEVIKHKTAFVLAGYVK